MRVTNQKEPRADIGHLNAALFFYAALLATLGLLPRKRRFSRAGSLAPISDRQVIVALTAYNDAESIAEAVTDFREDPLVRQRPRKALCVYRPRRHHQRHAHSRATARLLHSAFNIYVLRQLLCWKAPGVETSGPRHFHRRRHHLQVDPSRRS